MFLAESGGKDSAHKDMAVYVLEGALLWADGRVLSGQSCGADPHRGHIWRPEEAHEFYVLAA